jgi:hypothetical protein
VRWELCQHGPQHGLRGMLSRCDANRSRRFLSKLGETTELRLDLLEMRAESLQQPLPRISRREASRGAD